MGSVGQGRCKASPPWGESIRLSLGQGDSLICAGAPLGAQPLPPIEDTTPHPVGGWVGEEPSTHWGRGTTPLLSNGLKKSERGVKKQQGLLEKLGKGDVGGYPAAPSVPETCRPRRRPGDGPHRASQEQISLLVCFVQR